MNGLYRIGLCSADGPKLGFFPVDDSDKPLVVISLTLPIGWNNLLPFFCTATETVADLENQALCEHAPLRQHKLDNKASAVASAASPTLNPTLVPLSQDSLLLRTNAQLLAYVDVFIYNFLGLSQGPTHRHRHVCCTLFHALDKVFRPLNKLDPTQRKEVLSLKKLYEVDFSWSTCQVLLGWVVDTVNVTMCLPTHKASRLKEIIAAIPTQ